MYPASPALQDGVLKRHILTHNCAKPHKCKTCDKSFNLAGHLKAHLLAHSGWTCIE